jgi:hypothetical protein
MAVFQQVSVEKILNVVFSPRGSSRGPDTLILLRNKVSGFRSTPGVPTSQNLTLIGQQSALQDI